jgi:nitroreductase
VRGAGLVVAIAVRGGGPTAFDVGRAARNMMLVAWNEGIGLCPNGMPDPDRVSRVLGLGEDERSVIVVTSGYAPRVRDPQRRSAEEWVAADRKSFGEVVRRL